MTPIVIITSVDYSDFLRMTLPSVLKVANRVHVLTSPQDQVTQALCTEAGAGAYVTDVWQKHGAIFNKSAAITECLHLIAQSDEDAWVLLLDADILLPDGVDLKLPSLDHSCLYSAPRRICETKVDWQDIRTGQKSWASLPLDQAPVVDGRVWGKVPTANPTALLGYFQLWHLSALRGSYAMPPSRNAAGFDVRFAMKFADDRRHNLDFEVLHIGPIRLNWNGRVSVSWSDSA